MKKLLQYSLTAFFVSASLIAVAADADIKWTPIEKSMAEAKAANKKFILINLYTDWCGG